MATGDFFSFQVAANKGIAIVEETATTAPNGGKEGKLHVALDAGAAIIGTVAIDQTTPGTTNGVQVNAALPAGTNSIGSTKDNGPAWTVVRTVTTSADMSAPAAISAAPTSGQKVLADDIMIFSDTAMTFTIQEETSADVFAKVYLAANGYVQLTPRDGFKANAINKKFFGVASVPGNVSITLFQHSEA